MAGSAKYVTYRFGSFALDLERGALVAADGKEVPLRPKSFALLRLLVENAGRLVSQEDILQALWPDVFVTENNVTQCIHDIRRALGAEARQTLCTRPRRGYLFTADITAVPSYGKNDPNERSNIRPKPQSEAAHCDDAQSLLNNHVVQPQRPTASAPASGFCETNQRMSIQEASLWNMDVPNDDRYPVKVAAGAFPTGLEKYLASVVADSLEALHRNTGSTTLRENAGEFGVDSMIQDRLTRIVTRLAMDLKIANAKTSAHQQSNRLSIDLANPGQLKSEPLNTFENPVPRPMGTVRYGSGCPQARPPRRLSASLARRHYALEARPRR